MIARLKTISNALRSFGATPEMWAASDKLAELPPPKVGKGQASTPSYLKSAAQPGSVLPRTDLRLANTDIETFRTGTDTRVILRKFAMANSDMAAAVYAHARAAVSGRYVAVAKDPDGKFNIPATQLLQQLLQRMDVIKDYSDGFSGISSLRSISESLVKEIMYYGAASVELVLGKDRLPRAIVPISVSQIQFVADGTFLAPKQVVGSVEIDLDIPNFFYVALDQDLLEPYASSPLEPAIQPVQFATEFMNDLRRVIKKAVSPRLKVTMEYDKLMKLIPPEYQQQQDGAIKFVQTQIEQITAQLEDLRPEDALVMVDFMEASYLDGGNRSVDTEWSTLTDIINSKLATGLKTMPSILGHGSGSQNIASTETMLFIKSVTGIQAKVNELYSQALTLALRLFGLDVYVEFRYEAIDLRPELELEAFRAMRQSRVLEQLSLGLITDEQAALEITGNLPPSGMPKLSGTMFHKSAAPSGNGYTNQSTGGGAGGAANQQLKPGTPSEKRGGQK